MKRCQSGLGDGPERASHLLEAIGGELMIR
jgi:hypothetical protein